VQLVQLVLQHGPRACYTGAVHGRKGLAQVLLLPTALRWAATGTAQHCRCPRCKGKQGVWSVCLLAQACCQGPQEGTALHAQARGCLPVPPHPPHARAKVLHFYQGLCAWRQGRQPPWQGSNGEHKAARQGGGQGRQCKHEACRGAVGVQGGGGEPWWRVRSGRGRSGGGRVPPPFPPSTCTLEQQRGMRQKPCHGEERRGSAALHAPLAQLRAGASKEEGGIGRCLALCKGCRGAG